MSRRRSRRHGPRFRGLRRRFRTIELQRRRRRALGSRLRVSPVRGPLTRRRKREGRGPERSAPTGDRSPQARPTAGIPVWRQSIRLLGGRPSFIFWIVAASFVAGLCESFVLALLAQVAAALVSGTSRVDIHLGPVHLDQTIGRLLLLGIAVSMVRLGLQVLLSWLPARVSADTQASMRQRLFTVFKDSSWAVQSSDGEGKFQELMTSQILQATQAVIQSTTALTSGVLLVVLVASALVVGLVPALFVIGASVMLFVLLRPINKLGQRHARSLSTAQVAYAAGINDAVNIAEETQVFGTGRAQQRELDKLVQAAWRRFLSTQFLIRLVPGGYQGLIFLLLLAGLALLNAAHVGHVAALGAVVLLLVRASTYGQQLQGSFHALHQSLPFVERVDAAEARYRDSKHERGTLRLRTVPVIEFDDVSYSYLSDVPVLQNVSFAVRPGESVGVVGPTGAGKSTLVQILLGLREPGAGRYLVDGQDAREWSSDSWARQVSYLSQEPRLLHGSVADNIRFYRAMDQATIEGAARQAHIHDEIMTWPAGYDTEVSQRARAVSGGQRQRLCLARALAGKPTVLVLDEPTSALDPRSEALVQQSLHDLRGQLTLFVIAHRFSTLSLCDRVMVMGAGRVEAFAPADELVKSNDFYRRASRVTHAERLEASL